MGQGAATGSWVPGRIAMAASVAALATSAAFADPLPDSITIPLSERYPGTFPNVVTIKVGGGPASHVTFDVGSIGLYIEKSAIGAHTDTGIAFKYGYEDGNRFKGKIVYATVGFPDASTPVETQAPIALGMITKISCAKSKPHCPGMGEGRVGVMGARYYNSYENNIFNPLAFLPGNLSSGYMVAATGPTPSVIVGLTPNNTENFVFTPLAAQTTTGQGGVPRAWELKSINTCFSVDGGPKSCDVTSFDTGEDEGQFIPKGVGPGEITAKDYLKSGHSVTVTIPGVMTQTITSGDTAWHDLYKMISSPEGSPPGFNSGAQFYNGSAVAYDYVNGRAGFSPLTTWIAGTYRARDDRDLGPAGAIALDGTLILANDFSSARPMFLGGDTVLGSEGAAELSGVLSGSSTLTFDGPGELTLTGDSANTAPMLIRGGRLNVDGSTPAIVLVSNGILGGNGLIGALAAGGSGVVEPGHSIGTLKVSGDALFGPGSVYRAEIGADGHSDLIRIGGAATVGGGVLEFFAAEDEIPTISRYTVLTAAGGITGDFTISAPHFGKLDALYPFLAPEAIVRNDHIDLALTRSDIPFAALAETPNQEAVAEAADELGLSGAVVKALASLDHATAPDGFDQLSGEVHASARTVLTEEAGALRAGILARIDQAFGASAPAGEPTRSIAGTAAAAWAHAYAGIGQVDATANTAGVDSSVSGLIAGIDVATDPWWRFGVAFGYGGSGLSLDSPASSGSSESTSLAAFGGARLDGFGPGVVVLRGGAAYSWQSLSTSRLVSLPHLSETLTADYDASTAQVFAEAGYEVDLGETVLGETRLEPFAAVDHTDVATDAFAETGGAAALDGAAGSLSSTGLTLGVSADARHEISAAATLRLHALVGWRHLFGDLTPTEDLAFKSGESFAIAGASLSADSALIEAGIGVDLNERFRFDLAYSGAIASGAQTHSVKGTLAIDF